VQAASKNVAISQGIQVPCEPLELSSPDHLGGLSSMLLKGAVRRRQVSKKQRLAVESYGKSPEARIALWLKVHPDIPCLTCQPVEPATEGAGGVRLTHVFSGCILSSPSGLGCGQGDSNVKSQPPWGILSSGCPARVPESPLCPAGTDASRNESAYP
jgi:hypothetical protein